MSRAIQCRSALLLLLLAGPWSCASDGEALVSRQPGDLAVGTFSPFVISDACRGGKGSFCTSEDFVEVVDIRTDPEGIVKVVPASDLPPGFAAAGWGRALLAVAPGLTVLHGSASFSDGSVRSFERAYRVKPIVEIEPTWGCDGGERRVRSLVAAGHDIWVEARLLGHGGVVLEGFHPAALEAGLGLEGIPHTSGTFYSIVVPGELSGFSLTSGVLEDFSLHFDTFSEDDIVVVALAANRPMKLGERTFLDAETAVNGVRPCHELGFVAESLTPTVCTGPVRGEPWNAHDGVLPLIPWASGTCMLSVGPASATDPTRFEVPLDLQ